MPKVNGYDINPGANLRGANLTRANLTHANLYGADLRGANLTRANLPHANLYGADLSGANLYGADLTHANLRRANLRDADLFRANLSGANLTLADLTHADLRDANPRGAKLTGTCLDPSNLPNSPKDHPFEKRGGWVYAFRTKTSQAVGSQTYEVGQTYGVEIFSTSGTTCHPGLYVATHAWLDRNYPGPSRVQVRFRRKDLHQVGDKFRVKKFTVVADV